MRLDSAISAARALLERAGWRSDTSTGRVLWRDPVTGTLMPIADALALAKTSALCDDAGGET